MLKSFHFLFVFICFDVFVAIFTLGGHKMDPKLGEFITGSLKNPGQIMLRSRVSLFFNSKKLRSQILRPISTLGTDPR